MSKKNNRYDVIYDENRCYPQFHFCREYDCFGTNPEHGCTWEEAREEVAQYYQNLADTWREKKEDD